MFIRLNYISSSRVLSVISKWFLYFQDCLKKIIVVNGWMKNVDMINRIYLTKMTLLMWSLYINLDEKKKRQICIL
jgi:hypothetical protein